MADDDTIRVSLNGQVETVRYIGIDTPEIHHPRRGREPYGEPATAARRARLLAALGVRASAP